VPFVKVVVKRLAELYPTTTFAWFKISLINEIEDNKETRARYLEWAKGVDAVVGAIGD
jgi:hypothetical protein